MSDNTDDEKEDDTEASGFQGLEDVEPYNEARKDASEENKGSIDLTEEDDWMHENESNDSEEEDVDEDESSDES